MPTSKHVSSKTSVEFVFLELMSKKSHDFCCAYKIRLTIKLAKAMPMISLFEAISSSTRELLVKSDALDRGFSTQLPLTMANKLRPEVALNSSYRCKIYNFLSIECGNSLINR